jgi:exopolysaccharide production protein ExoZ
MALETKDNTVPPAAPARHEIVTVQWLRGIAALMVVVHHARNHQTWLFNPIEHYDALAWGVDIFFVISGFIMYVAARNERPIDFMRRRAIRVIPLYWVATLVWFQMTSRQPMAQLSAPALEHFIKSLLFIPEYSLSNPGEIFPYLIPGWSLNYEMFFYLVFFLALVLKSPLGITSMLIMALVSLGYTGHADGGAISKTYTSAQMLEFVAGLWIGKLWLHQRLGRQFVILLPVGLMGLLSLPFFWQGPTQLMGRLLFSSMILAGTVAANSYAPRITLLKSLGDASYSIYLSHTIIGLWLSRKLLALLHMEGWAQFLLWMAVSLFLCALTGYLTHIAIERPLAALFSRRKHWPWGGGRAAHP